MKDNFILGLSAKKKRLYNPSFADKEGVIQCRKGGGGFVARVPRTDDKGVLINGNRSGACMTIGKYNTRGEAQEAYDKYMANVKPKVNLNAKARYSAKDYKPMASIRDKNNSNKVEFISNGKTHRGYYNLPTQTYYAYIPTTKEYVPYAAAVVYTWRYYGGNNKYEPIKITS